LSTDHEWERWGQKDPYFAVVTERKFRRDRMTAEARESFFDSGERHVDYILHACRQLAGAAFAPRSVLDFGCGVGRVLLPLARDVERAVGIDISATMLAEARANADALGLGNVELLPSDDALSRVHGTFDLVHSSITLQHIEPRRARKLFARLVELVAEGGVGAIHATYASRRHARNHGRATLWDRRPSLRFWRPPARDLPGDPDMRMYHHDLNELTYLLQAGGIDDVRMAFTDHAGEMGVFLFFTVPRAAGARA